ncbi:MAG: hypothetical protein E7614_01740 [Ruminococcaceae bacterium]|nr:hypothetical protein [Oscillospiraceae bacterium]
MRYYTISLFGHREIYEHDLIEERLKEILREKIANYDFIEILMGRNGEFDEYAASIIKRIQKEAYGEKIELTLVLPYEIANMEDLEKYYDRIIIPEEFNKIHPKAAIGLRNKYMVDHSDIVVVYVNQSGGAYNALKYARKSLKETVNIADIL